MHVFRYKRCMFQRSCIPYIHAIHATHHVMHTIPYKTVSEEPALNQNIALQALSRKHRIQKEQTMFDQ